MNFSAITISGNPEAFRQCLLPALSSSRIPEELEFILIISSAGAYRQNQEAVEGSSLGIPLIHLEESDTKNKIIEKVKGAGKDVGELFYGKLTGPRNAGLLLSASLGLGAVFLDDDVEPLEHCLERHAGLFSKGLDIIPGQYLGHRGFGLLALLELSHRLEDLRRGVGNRQLILEQIRDNASGVTPYYTRIRFQGPAAGNMGISPRCGARFPFCPSDHRGMDDVLYERAAKKLAPDFSYFPEPGDCKEVVELINEIPIVRHTKTRGEACISSLVRDEMLGSVMIKVLLRTVLDKFPGKPDEEAGKAAQETFDEYAMPKFIELFGGMAKVVESIGDEDIVREIRGIVGLKAEDITPSEGALKEQIERYGNALEIWPGLVAGGQMAGIARDILYND